MEKCPNCHKETITTKEKLSLAPGDCHICKHCHKKLKVEGYAYFVHGLYLLVVGIAIFNFSLVAGLITAIGTTICAFFVIVKVIPLKVEDSEKPYKKESK